MIQINIILGVSLLSGATLCILSESNDQIESELSNSELKMEKSSKLLSPQDFYNIIKNYKITHVDIPPSYLTLLEIDGNDIYILLFFSQ
jgi:hypothetical protein